MNSPSNLPNQTSKGKEIVVMDPTPLNDDYCLDTDDELEMLFYKETCDDQGPSYENSPVHYLEGASCAGSASKVDHYVSMGFPKNMVIQAMKENGEDNEDAIVNSLLTYEVLEKDTTCSSPISKLPSDNEDDLQSDFSDSDSACGDVERSGCDPEDQDGTISIMVDMGYRRADVVLAKERCGPKASVAELADFISAADLAKLSDMTEFPANTQNLRTEKKRKTVRISHRHGRQTKRSARLDSPERRMERSSHQMIGFGLPGCPLVTSRKLLDDAVGPPYFYYENVAFTPKGVWEQISSFLYEIEPEFVDSIHFSAAMRKRGYIHNLPIENRELLLPIPPKTIHEAIPETKKWWPWWDKRTKLNCLLTCIGSAQLTERIRRRVEHGEPSESDKRFVIEQCKKWNLVWVGKSKVAVLEPEEMEMLLGFPKHHTRGGGISRTDRYKALGNSFQIDTVAYHLSVLRPKYPNGMNVLSLFSGIGGAEVALHRLGIKLNNVVSVENCQVNRQILQDWWDQTGQTGNLEHVNDVQSVDAEKLDAWIEKFNGFDLVIGGSPCNNLAGGNRRTRDGLEGDHSSLFFDYYRILFHVRNAMRQRASSNY